MNVNKRLDLHSFSSPRRDSVDIYDFLATNISSKSFEERICDLGLSPELEEKIVAANVFYDSSSPARSFFLTKDNEKELASEVLIARHRFSNILLQSKVFRQATITVLQNIYLFRNRKIYFTDMPESTQCQRQDALDLFSNPIITSIPLAKTLTHLIISRIWHRINQLQHEHADNSVNYIELHHEAERLNTIRNAFMLLAHGLVKKIAGRVPKIYKEGLAYEDTVQVGVIGVGRAAYRYHHNCGIRFSTFAANYIRREIQQKALENRLIRISSNVLEQHAKLRKTSSTEELEKKFQTIINSSVQCDDRFPSGSDKTPHIAQPESTENFTEKVERQQIHEIIENILETVLTPKNADIIRRKYGLFPYNSQPQSAIEIGLRYGVTRSAIYQIEKNTLLKLREILEKTVC